MSSLRDNDMLRVQLIWSCTDAALLLCCSVLLCYPSRWSETVVGVLPLLLLQTQILRRFGRQGFAVGTTGIFAPPVGTAQSEAF